jgi:hypothetical protein
VPWALPLRLDYRRDQAEGMVVRTHVSKPPGRLSAQTLFLVEAAGRELGTAGRSGRQVAGWVIVPGTAACQFIRLKRLIY